jgi:hypothetical protein
MKHIIKVHLGFPIQNGLKQGDDLNLLADNIDTINKKREILIDASKEVGLEVIVEETKYMLVSWNQNAGQNWDIKIRNRSFENVSQFRHLGTTVTNQNLILEEIKRRLNSGNACYHSVQNLLSSRLLSKNVKILYGWRNLVPTFADRGVSRGKRGRSPTVVTLSFLDRSRYFSK